VGNCSTAEIVTLLEARFGDLLAFETDALASLLILP
jgi:hypothetical protein